MKIKAVLFLVFLPLISLTGAPYQADFVLGRVQFKGEKDSGYQDLKKDFVVQEGSFIRTGKNSMVKLLDAQGNRMMILANTTFRIVPAGEKEQVMEILAGASEFRPRKGEVFSVRTPTLSAGVRGTLFRVSYEPGGNESVVVYEGKVAVSSPVHTDKGELLIEEGSKFQWVPAQETFSSFLIQAATEQDLDFYLKDGIAAPKTLQKQQGEPEQLAQQELTEAKEIPLETEKIPEEIKKPEEKKTPEKKQEPEKLKPEEPRFWYLNFSLGGMEKSGRFYQSLMIMPGFSLGKWVTLKLFLPVFYDGQSKIYDVSRWGNKEDWDFSSSKDALHDLLLKIHTFQFREKGDIVYLRAGTLEKVTVGSGFMFQNFNSSPLFPVQRVLGLEAGFDMGVSGLDLFFNDIYDPEIMGGRFFFRPLFALPLLGKFQIGLQAGIDKNPLGKFHNPAFFYFALDFNLPLLELDALSLTFFADIAKQGMYYADWEKRPAVWADGTDFMHVHLNDNYGMDAGFKGNITRNFLFELRYYYLHSGFTADYFDSFYMVQRQVRAQRVLTPGLADVQAIKFLAGINLDILSFQAGYTHETSTDEASNRFTAELKTKRGAFWRFYLEAVYEKRNIAEVFSGKYKKDAVLDIQLGYMFTGNADIVFRKLISYDAQGNQESRISLETRFLF